MVPELGVPPPKVRSRALYQSVEIHIAFLGYVQTVTFFCLEL